MFIPDPDFCPSRIPDPKTATKDRGEKNLKTMLIFEVTKKKIWANLQRIIELSTQKLSLRSQKYGFGVRKNLFWIRDPGSGSATRLLMSPHGTDGRDPAMPLNISKQS